MSKKVSVFWFRRDLRLEDNTGLFHALNSGLPVLPLFIYDTDILDELKDKQDKRLQFISLSLKSIANQLQNTDSDLLVRHGKPLQVWSNLIEEYDIRHVFTNHDYEPYAINRDKQIKRILESGNIQWHTFKDQVIFEKHEIVKDDGQPYTVYTPYSKRWRSNLTVDALKPYPSKELLQKVLPAKTKSWLNLADLGFKTSSMRYPASELREKIIRNYHKTRDFPAIDGTSRLSVHLRFGTVSIRQLVLRALELNDTWLSELIWREFFMQVLYHFPYVVNNPFKEKYAAVKWRDDEQQFEKWCQGRTGYPLVDAGMRELNQTGYMHNRVRMVTASFLCKQLLIDWRRGERYFAEKLLDYDLSANNGNWQWAAGCGCDAAPYFRIFNPTTQMKKFDADLSYIKKWVPEYGSKNYPAPIVDHQFARQRALSAYEVVKDQPR